MNALLDAPGVLSAPLKSYVVPEDVQVILGCKRTKAYECIQQVNEKAKEKGIEVFSAGKANKYLFAEMLGVPVEDVNQVIKHNSRKGGCVI